MKGIILGAGVTGLAAGIKTGWPVYEAKDKPGGICRSYRMQGYHFENGGGHWIFGADDALEFLSKYCALKKYNRISSAYLNQFIDYPIQKTLGKMEPALPGSLKRWFHDKFGNEMCRLFFYPFNEKYTAGLYNRVIQDDQRKSPSVGGQGYNDEFYYPKDGLDSMVDKMAQDVNVQYLKRAVSIDLKNKLVKFFDGEEVKYDKLISTLPLVETLEMAGIKQDDLPSTSVMVLNIGAERQEFTPLHHWLYISDPAIRFHRIGFYSNVDPMFAESRQVNMYVERAFYDKTPEGDYNDHVIRTLKRWGWIGYVDVCHESWIKHAYTWMFYDSPRKKYLRALEDNGITSIGRYGKWKFQGIAESILDGLGIKW